MYLQNYGIEFGIEVVWWAEPHFNVLCMFFALYTEYFTMLDIKYLQVLQISIPIRNILRHHYTLVFLENVKNVKRFIDTLCKTRLRFSDEVSI